MKRCMLGSQESAEEERVGVGRIGNGGRGGGGVIVVEVVEVIVVEAEKVLIMVVEAD